LFVFLRVIGLLLRSEAPGLAFSVKRTAASHQSLQESPMPLVFCDSV
jgi:hypothetical protein